MAVTARPTTEAAWKHRFRAARIGFPTWARDDPDHLLYLSNASGKFEVYAWDRTADRRWQVTDRPEGTGYRVPSRLDPSGRHIWWFDDAKGNELGRWVREPFAGGERRETIAPGLAPSYSAWLAIGRDFAVLGRSRSDEGTSVYLVREGAEPKRIYAHRQSANVAGLSRDETMWALSHSEHGDSRNRAVRVLDLGGNTVADLWDGPGRGLEPGRWSPLAGDQRLLVLHERAGVRRPVIYDAARKTEIDVTLDLPGETFADWYPDAKALLIGHDHRGRSELYRYDVATRALTPLPTERGTIGSAAVRPEGEIWYMLDRSAEPATVRSQGGGVVLRPDGPPAPSGVSYHDDDVDGVHVFVAEPKGSRPHPTYFFIHGGPSAHDRDAFSAVVQSWVDHGVAVVMVNYRGSSGYGKAWRDAIVGRPGLTELEDIAKVQDWAVATGLADRKRSVLGGGSWGGYLTLLGLGVQPERWAAGIAIVPIGDYIAAFEDEMEPLKRYDAALFGGTPTEVPETYRVANPITYVDRVRAPVIMLVGENDPRCPARGVDVYQARMRELGTPYEEYRYDAGHGSLVVDEQIKQVGLEIDFVARHLGTPPPRP